MSENGPNLGVTLRALRNMRGASLKTVAAAADISTAYLQKLEKGEVVSPSPHVLKRLADPLGTDYGQLMGAAGYDLPSSSGAASGALAEALGTQSISEEEARALSAFLKVFRADS